MLSDIGKLFIGMLVFVASMLMAYDIVHETLLLLLRFPLHWAVHNWIYVVPAMAIGYLCMIVHWVDRCTRMPVYELILLAHVLVLLLPLLYWLVVFSGAAYGAVLMFEAFEQPEPEVGDDNDYMFED